jgi:hypothetical protein
MEIKPLAGTATPPPLECLRLIKLSNHKLDFIRRVANPLVASNQFTTLWYLSRGEKDGEWKANPLWDDESQRLWPTIEPSLGLALKAAPANGSPWSMSLGEFPNHMLRLAQVPTVGGAIEYLCALCPGRGHSAYHDAALNALASAAILCDYTKTNEALAVQSEFLSQWIGVSQAILSGTDRRSGLFQAATGIRKITGAAQVSLVICQPDGTHRRLVALSDVESFDPTSPLVKQIELAAALPLDEGTEIAWTAATHEQLPQPTLRDYCVAANFDACYAAPLKTRDGQWVGSILLGGRTTHLAHPQRAAQTQRLTAYLADALATSQAAHAPLTERALAKFRSIGRGRWAKWCAIAAASAGLAMLIPIPYQLHCDCQLQPLTRRFVAAPFEGVLEETLAQPGDLVSEGQVLARLDGRNLRTKLVGLQAQLDGERNRHQAALARGDVADSQIAAAECKRLTAETELAQDRLAELNVCSPIAGIVVSGDLNKVQGVRLEMGQNLFEVAPLDRMRAEIAVPESEIRFVRPEQRSRVLLDAYPYESWSSPVSRIRPRTEIRDDASVFVAEAIIPNSENRLRPGMKGRGRITSDYRLLGWILFHRAWESVRQWLYL